MTGIKSFCNNTLVVFYLARFSNIREVIYGSSLRIVMSSCAGFQLSLFINDFNLFFIFSGHLVKFIKLLFFDFVFFPDCFFIQSNFWLKFWHVFSIRLKVLLFDGLLLQLLMHSRDLIEVFLFQELSDHKVFKVITSQW
jgi:hypothetical protein